MVKCFCRLGPHRFLLSRMLWVASCFVISEILLFYFTDYALALPVELISTIYLHEKSSYWLIDSGATKHMCHDKSAHKQNPLMVWHHRLSHVSFLTLIKLASLGKLGSLTKISLEDFKLCIVCLVGTFFT